MLFTGLIIISGSFLLGVLAILPDWSIISLIPNAENFISEIFTMMKFILELPILRVFWFYTKLFIPIWLVFRNWNLIMRILSTIPFLHGLGKLQLKDKSHD